MISRRSLITFIAASPVLISSLPAWARAPRFFQTNSGVAMNGYDAVAYFTMQKPVKGVAKYAFEYEGANFHFSSSENLEMFKTNPQKYAPVFGGYCAYAASLGYRAATVPEAWTVYDGKLYLNASLRARTLWLKDVPGNIKKGNKNWPKILDA